jgi:hypothetical protein
LIGEFTDATGIAGFQGAKIVTQTLAEKLLEWNQLLQAKDIPVEPAPAIDLGSMSWIKVLWVWVMPPPRAFKLDGVLLGDQPGAYKLAVRRTDLSANSIDASYTFSSAKPVAEAAFQELAGAAARWAGHPCDIEASEAAQRGIRAVRGEAEAAPLSADEVYQEAISLLLPVRQQLNLGAVDHADARDRLRQAEELLKDLPAGSGLYADLRAVVTDLNRALPA